ncbi:hypothetical protein MN2019_23860 [Mycolicibacterium neoaurum]|nr:hypothetical protein MN2019_23860 [Mycolicibacterium neoaurum]
MCAATAGADPPSDEELIRPLPVVVPVDSIWSPKFPFPWEATKDRVTAADVAAGGEICQWYTAQYDTLMRQVDRLQFNRLDGWGSDWNYAIGGVQNQVDIVTANIDQSTAYLAPRAQALTQFQNYVGDWYFALYKGDAFYRLWEQLGNVSAGIKGHQPAWFTGPSLQHAKHWGSEINRSHVCG